MIKYTHCSFGTENKTNPLPPFYNNSKRAFLRRKEFHSSGWHLLQGGEKNSITKVDMWQIWGVEMKTNLLILYFYPVLEKSETLTSPLGIEQETFTSAFLQSASMQEEKQLFPSTFITIPTFTKRSVSLCTNTKIFLKHSSRYSYSILSVLIQQKKENVPRKENKAKKQQ